MEPDHVEPVLVGGSVVAEILGISLDQVRYLADRGVLEVHSRTDSDRRRYELAKIKDVARQGITAKTRKQLIAQTDADIPTRGDLWMRHQLAVSVLNQRGPSTETAALVRRILNGETVELLVSEAS